MTAFGPEPDIRSLTFRVTRVYQSQRRLVWRCFGQASFIDFILRTKSLANCLILPIVHSSRRRSRPLRPWHRNGRRHGLDEHAAHQPARHSGRNERVHDPVDPAGDDDGPADADLLASPLTIKSASIFRAREAGTRAFKMRFSRPGTILERFLSRPLRPSDTHCSPHLSTRQYSRIVNRWVTSIGLDAASYGTHSMRRTKATLIYRRTKNLRAVQLLLGHTKLESTVRYLGIEVDDALEIAEQTEV
jgi:integrase-like protein